MEWLAGLQRSFERRRVERGACKDAVAAREECLANYGAESSLCTRLKLAEKRCLAEHLCPREFLQFYGGTKPCANIVEKFCNDEDEEGESGQSIPKRCRWASYALGDCLHKYA
ncbi:Hypothetical Protein FCC1311_021412 [Hondaea fermentalgiana]|uniref:Uncharacterized protein n=1 Tax=Hondaea fermentalgiana TaxID=2315210 RepID=A0A2R5G4H1_9STRA|nr:Hypothetical Protein FCC1311_021412 [Hondaea fermentalgiana]|eukprot:GBG25922.1 Hypothetical Protein FCC1311_021412 [Hondaea fermentalgiana]